MELVQQHHEDEAIALVVAWRKGGGFEFGRAQVEDTFNTNLRSIMDATEANLAECESKDYAIGDDIEGGESMTIVFEELERIAAMNAPHDRHNQPRPRREHAVRSGEPRAFRDSIAQFGALPPVTGTFLREKDTKFYAIVRRRGEVSTIYLRKIDPMRIATPGNIIARITDRISALNENIFVMDQKIDLVIRANSVDIVSKGAFDSLFFDITTDSATIDGLVRAALAPLPMQDATLARLVARTLGKSRPRKKLLEIQHGGHLANVTMQRFRDALTKKEIDHARFIQTQNDSDFIFASDMDIDLLLQILNDDLYRGDLTDQPYVAAKKAIRR